MTREDNLKLLRDEGKSVIERLKAAVKLEVDYWNDPNKSPPNLSQEEFEKLLVYIPLSSPIRWEKRKSLSGTYGASGEDEVFNTEFEIIRGRFKFIYYLKGYFFEKGNLKGVCIQSFRIDRKLPRSALRTVK